MPQTKWFGAFFCRPSIQFNSVSLRQITQGAFVHFSILGSFFAELEVTKEKPTKFELRKRLSFRVPTLGGVSRNEQVL
jgi:hypothetical protein